jgi:hypothetical protein
MVKVVTEYEQISGLFEDQYTVELLLDDLRNRGLANEDISVLMSESTGNRYFTMKEENKMPEGAAVGGLSGGLIGAAIGSLTLVGTVLLPGSGFLVAGPLVGALAGGTLGTAAGGLLGALVGMGVPEHEAKFYENALKEDGNILVVAHILKNQVQEFKAVFERYDAKGLKVHS